MNTPIYRKGGNCISKTLSVSKGIPLNISHTHKDTHKHAVRLLPNRGKTKWTNTNTHREGSEGLKPADDSSWIHTPRNKNTENLLGEVLFEQVLAGCRMCGDILYQCIMECMWKGKSETNRKANIVQNTYSELRLKRAPHFWPHLL